MKFPLTQRPYAPLQLSVEERAAHARTAMTLVRESVDEFDAFIHHQNRTMDPKLWKAVRTRENVTVYKKRELEEMTDSVSAITKWPLPKLLGVGSIVGDFDDVMYGVISPDVSSIKVKTTYVDDELVDCEVLDIIEHGTMDDPYHFIGIKWVCKSTPSGNIVRPRDFLLIEATGIYVNDAGERYGYHAMHSVDLPQCPPLNRIGILRGKLSSCFLFKSMPNRTIEIFMKSFVEPAGNVPDVVAIMSAVNGLIGFWKSVYCAEKKKLAWLLRHSKLTRPARQRTMSSASISMTDSRGRECCVLCTQRFSTFRSPIECELCHTVVCSRCETTRKLTFVDGRSVKKIAIPICKNCLTSVSNMNAAEFARREHVPSVRENRQQSTPLGIPKFRLDYDRHDIAHSARGYPRAMSWDHFDTFSSSERSSVPTTLSMDISTDDTPPPMTVMDETSEGLAVVEKKASLSPLPSQPDDLWLRMQQLHIQAEQAYQLTTHNNKVMAETIRSHRRTRPATNTY